VGQAIVANSRKYRPADSVGKEEETEDNVEEGGDEGIKNENKKNGIDFIRT
jgi:hypothetical protein